MPLVPYDPTEEPERDPYLPDFDEILDRILNGDDEQSPRSGGA